ncbi:MAG TPA: radical SAM protein, partial [Candidatus Deferrimicrobium sp.]|nr:radical SAM protein [Candidatus Deferrimicrobium sp.]
SHTMALCPECREKIQARLINRDGEDGVYLEKFCPRHGGSRALVSSDVKWYEDSVHYVKPGQEPLKRNVETFNGCPDSCGFCSHHLQHTCLPIIEITNHCQLNCPICLKNETPPYSLTVEEFAGIIANLLATEGKMDVINISGGEPTLHPELEAMIDIALAKGVVQVSVSTNGLRLLDDKKIRNMFKRTETIAALQFDGFSPSVYTFLRGKDLLKQKMQLIEILEAEDIHYSLVTSAARGINDTEIPRIADFFFQSKALSLMFQPLTFTGSAEKLDPGKLRLTIPCIVRELERSRHVKKGDFTPLACSHYSCFALSYYLQLESNEYTSLKSFLGAENCAAICANKTLPGLDSEGFAIIRDRIYELWSAADSSNLDERILARIKNILRNLESGNLSNRQKLALGAKHMKAIFIHHFMDVHTMDLGRLVKCCNPYPRTGNRLIPMCAENVFSRYRK